MRKFVARIGSDPHFSPLRACAGMDTEVFFPFTDAEARVAQKVCAVCPVLSGCAAWALRAGVTDGVVASVWLPGLNGRRGLPAMRRRLMKVAATGRPDTEDARREVA